MVGVQLSLVSIKYDHEFSYYFVVRSSRAQGIKT